MSGLKLDCDSLAINTRKTMYELVSFVGGGIEIVGRYAWKRVLVNDYFEELIAQLIGDDSVGSSRNASSRPTCASRSTGRPGLEKLK